MYYTPPQEGVNEWRIIARSRRTNGLGMTWVMSTLKCSGYRNFRIKGYIALTGTSPTSYPYLQISLNNDTTAGHYNYEYTKIWNGVITETESIATNYMRLGELPTTKLGYFVYDIEITQPLIPPREASSTTALTYPQIKARCDVVDTDTPNSGYFLASGIYNSGTATDAITQIDVWGANVGSATGHNAMNLYIPSNYGAML
jgi:hypothetical protein